jgi:hypothetical protein
LGVSLEYGVDYCSETFEEILNRGEDIEKILDYDSLSE